MVKFKETNYNEMRENLRREFLDELDEAMPKSKWRQLVEATTSSVYDSCTDNDAIVGTLFFVSAIVMLISAEIKWPGWILLVVGCVILITILTKEAITISGVMREYREIEKILPEWEMASYDKCVEFAEEYKNYDGACFTAPNFLYYHRYLKAMETIEQMKILDICYNSAGNHMYITYEDKEGNVKDYECPNCEVRKNTVVTEEILEVTEKKLIYTIPYQKGA